MLESNSISSLLFQKTVDSALGEISETLAAFECGEFDARVWFDTEGSILDEDIQADLQEFSARMEEVASNSQEIAAAIDDAREAGESGLAAIEEADDSSTTVRETSDELVGTVETLGETTKSHR
jgi:hypothetical protein